MAKQNKKLSKTINKSGARHLSIDAGLIRAYLAEAINCLEKGVFNELLTRCQINPRGFATSGSRIPFEKVSKVFNRARLLLGDEELCWLERPVPDGYFRLMLLAAIHTETLADALQRICEYRNVATASLRYGLSVEGGQLICEIAQQPDKKAICHGAVDFYLSAIVRILSWLGNKTVVPTIVRLTFPAPSYIDEYRFLYHGATVLFDQPTNSISFDKEALMAKVAQDERGLEKYLRQTPRDLFFPRYISNDHTQSVRDAIHNYLAAAGQAPTLELIAGQLKCGPQTLSRRLDAEGTSFHDIKLQVRRDMAVYLLNRGGVSIERIAEMVGYTESGNFIRAFKAWTGMTPRQFRKSV